MSTAGWAGWIALVMAVTVTSTNPLYLALTLLSVALVALLAPVREGGGPGIRLMAFAGLGLLAGSLLVAVVNGGSGEHVLFTVPGIDAPRYLGGLTLGGDVTAEAMVAAAIRGLVVLTMLVGFAVFSAVVSPHRALRLAPAALFHAGLVVTVGLTLLPSTVADLARIREMQALRGGSTGLRSLPGIVVPAVLGGLERSMRLAEAMEARGYAAAEPAPAWARLLGASAAPLLISAAWLHFYYADYRLVALALVAAGLVAIIVWGREAAHRLRATRYHVEHETALAWSLARASLAASATILAADLGGWLPTDYNPFAGLAMPAFGLFGATLALLPLWPLPFLLGRAPAPGEAWQAAGEPAS